jgi:glycine/D-amino acid oxidase-like deaminating enzyme
METYDVAIIGGGLAGISTAYFLSKAGKRCVVFETKEIGSGATALTTAFITHFLDTSLADLEKIFGSQKARLAWQSHAEAIDVIEKITKEEKIESSFMRCPGYYYASTEKDIDDIEKEYETAQRLEFNLTWREKDYLPFHNFGSLEFKNQAKFYAKKYIAGLAQAAQKQGAHIFEHAPVEDIKKEGNEFSVVLTKSAVYSVKDVVIATYYPFGPQTKTHFKKGMYVSYVFKLKIPKNALPYAIYEDTENPYNYFRVDEDDRF